MTAAASWAPFVLSHPIGAPSIPFLHRRHQNAPRLAVISLPFSVTAAFSSRGQFFFAHTFTRDLVTESWKNPRLFHPGSILFAHIYIHTFVRGLAIKSWKIHEWMHANAAQVKPADTIDGYYKTAHCTAKIRSICTAVFVFFSDQHVAKRHFGSCVDPHTDRYRLSAHAAVPNSHHLWNVFVFFSGFWANKILLPLLSGQRRKRLI